MRENWERKSLEHEGAKALEGRAARSMHSAEGASSGPARLVFPHDLAASCSRSLRGLLRAVGDIIYGATVYEMVRDLQKERAQIEHLFILVVFGDLLGVPILPPYYTLRLLPYVVPNIAGWRRSMLRERDITDLCDQEIT